MQPIGVIRSRHAEPTETPVQAGLNRDDTATVDLDPEFAVGLTGLEAFDYAWLLTWLADVGVARSPAPLLQVPFFLGRAPRKIGMFAMRGPNRINPIGLSLVRVLSINGSQLRFAGVDMVDGTAVLDIKPYVRAFDLAPGNPRCGWYDETDLPTRATPASLRGEVDPD